jgi:hypothetical protein
MDPIAARGRGKCARSVVKNGRHESGTVGSEGQVTNWVLSGKRMPADLPEIPGLEICTPAHGNVANLLCSAHQTCLVVSMVEADGGTQFMIQAGSCIRPALAKALPVILRFCTRA